MQHMQQWFCSSSTPKTFVDTCGMSHPPKDADAARVWIKRERDKRGWSTTKLANIARSIAHREGSPIKLAQQLISSFEQPGGGKRLPAWLPYVVKAFEEGDQPNDHPISRRDELVYIREVDISYAMGAGVDVEQYPETNLIPFNLGFIQALSRAPVERLFLATGHGESMEPTLLRHDLILVDTSQRQVGQSDLIWALNYAGGSMVKRLRRVRRDGSDRLLILSDNPSVPPEEADYEDVHIVGKVVWVGRRM